MSNTTIKELSKDHYSQALELVLKVFREFEAPDYSSEGIDEFYRSVCNEEYLTMLTIDVPIKS